MTQPWITVRCTGYGVAEQASSNRRTCPSNFGPLGEERTMRGVAIVGHIYRDGRQKVDSNEHHRWRRRRERELRPLNVELT